MLRAVFSLPGLNRSVALATGGACGYAFTNPDVDNVYDLFPLQKAPPFAFLNTFKVKEGEHRDFEESWKDLARHNQNQEGYLFTKLHKAQANESLGTAQFDYIDIVQWTTGDAYRRASLRASHKEVFDKLRAEGVHEPLMYTLVVDDTVIQNS
eukprot:TRINITY_DN10496_c0_g1_i1.p2 TRINITY_DN10496_c0_g1~~TRINITY_DN10496_c0_g1_i1.p2  ORF type:complete len:153 (+),score=40.70 TRINITY_DN10496_c0_g1_i1:129-587(+)